MTHVTCRLTAKNSGISSGTLRSVIEYWLPFFTRVSQYQKGILTNMDFTEARDSEWQWHQLGHMQVCTSPLTDNHASTPPLRFLQAECPSCTFQWHSIAVSVTHLSGSFERVFARLTAACRPN